MKIAIVAPFFTPFIKGNEYLLASYLAQAGHQVHVIASSAKAPRGYPEGSYNLELPVVCIDNLGPRDQSHIPLRAVEEANKRAKRQIQCSLRW